jgi:signal peptidase I
MIFGSKPRRTAVRVLVLTAVCFIAFRWVLIPIRAEGISMVPTYQSGSLNIVNRLAFTSRKPSRGEIVAIRLAGPNLLYVKRIIGLPGEELAIVQGHVYINGARLNEPYVRHRRPWDLPALTLEGREYFVIGDNRGMRAADHDFGRVDVSRIVGRVIF